ncbi:alpha-hydroxy-acid oxidizing protein, partial [Kibdelosporangium lantanae]
AHGGEDGVRHAVRSVMADFDLTLALTGHKSLAELGPDSLIRT